MAEAELLPLQPDLLEQDAPSADYLPLAHRIMAVAFFAFFTGRTQGATNQADEDPHFKIAKQHTAPIEFALADCASETPAYRP